MAVSARTIYMWMNTILFHSTAARCVGKLSCFNRQSVREMASILPVDSSRKSVPKPVTWATVVATLKEDSSSERNANKPSDRTGPGPQPLRGMSGFPAQQQAQARNAALASTRLPNGKIGATALFRIQHRVSNGKTNSYGVQPGGGANWNFGLPMGGAPGLQSNQQRNIGTMGSFAQSLGGSQPATPLDLS